MFFAMVVMTSQRNEEVQRNAKENYMVRIGEKYCFDGGPVEERGTRDIQG